MGDKKNRPTRFRISNGAGILNQSRWQENEKKGIQNVEKN
jgi:hypothetical protein